METGRNTLVRGLYADFPSLRTCADALKAQGLSAADMSVLLADGTVVTATSIEFLTSRKRTSDGSQVNRRSEEPSSASALSRALMAFGVPVYVFERLESRMRNGGILLSVRCNGSLLENVEGIFVETGAEEISFVAERRTEVVSCRHSHKPCVPVSVQSWHEPAANA